MEPFQNSAVKDFMKVHEQLMLLKLLSAITAGFVITALIIIPLVVFDAEEIENQIHRLQHGEAKRDHPSCGNSCINHSDSCYPHRHSYEHSHYPGNSHFH